MTLYEKLVVDALRKSKRKMPKDVDDRLIWNAIYSCCRLAGLAGFSHFVEYRFKKNIYLYDRKRDKHTLRHGVIAWANGAGEITICKPKWDKLTPHQKRFVIQHEVCHILDFLHGRNSGHGKQWLAFMKKVGADYRNDPTLIDSGDIYL